VSWSLSENLEGARGERVEDAERCRVAERTVIGVLPARVRRDPGLRAAGLS
jgi:hypothetical protein